MVDVAAADSQGLLDAALEAALDEDTGPDHFLRSVAFALQHAANGHLHEHERGTFERTVAIAAQVPGKTFEHFLLQLPRCDQDLVLDALCRYQHRPSIGVNDIGLAEHAIKTARRVMLGAEPTAAGAPVGAWGVSL